MRPALELLRGERRARIFFAAHVQSALGTGASYVALLLIAYDRFRSPWAVTCMLLAEFLPSVLLGPLLGAAADRWPRRRLLVAADLLRAGAFLGLALVGSFGATLALALVAGVGNALFAPTVMAALPSLVERRRLPAATSLFAAVDELGYTAGPALAGVALVFVGPERLLGVNAATFVVSALALGSLLFTAASPSEGQEAPGGLRTGLRAVAALGGVRVLLLASTAVVACLGMVNVGELVLAREALGAGPSGYGALVAAMGGGIAVGSLLGSRGGSPLRLRDRYLSGLAVCAAALLVIAVAPSLVLAVPAFFVLGLGNGVALSHENLILQTTVPDGLLGRAFGARNALASAAFVIAFLSAGALASTMGPRPLFALAGAGVLLAWGLAALALRRAPDPRAGAPRGVAPEGAAG